MSKMKHFFSLAIAASIFITACSKKDSDSTSKTVGTTTGNFTASIDGAAFSATKLQAYIEPGTQLLIITGSNGKKGITLAILNPAVGTFKTDSSLTHGLTNLSFCTPDSTNEDNRFISNGDNIYVTSYDASKHTISGTFSFKGYATGTLTGTETITTGVFKDVIFSVPAGSSISANIAGVAFNPAVSHASNSSGYVSLSGALNNSGGFPALSIFMPVDATVGTHDLATSYDYSVSYLESSSSTYSSSSNFTGTPGTVVITKNDVANKIITGTFSVNAADGNGNIKVITGGKFTASY